VVNQNAQLQLEYVLRTYIFDADREAKIKLAMDNGANPNEVGYISTNALVAHSVFTRTKFDRKY